MRGEEEASCMKVQGGDEKTRQGGEGGIRVGGEEEASDNLHSSSNNNS